MTSHFIPETDFNTSHTNATAESPAAEGHAASIDQTSAMKATAPKLGVGKSLRVGKSPSKQVGGSTSMLQSSQEEDDRTLPSNLTNTEVAVRRAAAVSLEPCQNIGWARLTESSDALAMQAGVGLNLTIRKSRKLWDELKNGVDQAIQTGERLVLEVNQITANLSGAHDDIHQFFLNAQKAIDHLQKAMIRDGLKFEKINAGGVQVPLTPNMREKLKDHSMFQFLKMRGLDEDLSGEPFVDVDSTWLVHMLGSRTDSTTTDSTVSLPHKNKKRKPPPLKNTVKNNSTTSSTSTIRASILRSPSGILRLLIKTYMPRSMNIFQSIFNTATPFS